MSWNPPEVVLQDSCSLIKGQFAFLACNLMVFLASLTKLPHTCFLTHPDPLGHISVTATSNHSQFGVYRLHKCMSLANKFCCDRFCWSEATNVNAKFSWSYLHSPYTVLLLLLHCKLSSQWLSLSAYALVTITAMRILRRSVKCLAWSIQFLVHHNYLFINHSFTLFNRLNLCNSCWYQHVSHLLIIWNPLQNNYFIKFWWCGRYFNFLFEGNILARDCPDWTWN